MRAATNTRYGAPHVLVTRDVPRPELGAHQVLVEVHASVVTQGDRRLREADFPGITAPFGRLAFGVFGPRHPVGGTMVAGRVVEVGAEVTRFAIGDRVFGSVMRGAYAELLAVGEDEPIALMPDTTTYAEAAAIPYGGVTALVFLRDLAEVTPGDRVLILGASGGVGRMAVQVAKHLGAEVTGVCSRAQALVRELGADRIIDHRHEDFTEGGERWDVILDCTEGNHFGRSRRALTETGRYLTLYASTRVLFEMALTKLTGGPRAIVYAAMGTREHMDDLSALVADGALRPVIAKHYPLEQIAEAHAALETEHPRGSLVIDIAEQPAVARSEVSVGHAASA